MLRGLECNTASHLVRMEEEFLREKNPVERELILDSMIEFMARSLYPTDQWEIVYLLVQEYGSPEQKKRLSDSQRALLHSLRVRVL